MPLVLSGGATEFRVDRAALLQVAGLAYGRDGVGLQGEPVFEFAAVAVGQNVSKIPVEVLHAVRELSGE